MMLVLGSISIIIKQFMPNMDNYKDNTGKKLVYISASIYRHGTLIYKSGDLEAIREKGIDYIDPSITPNFRFDYKLSAGEYMEFVVKGGSDEGITTTIIRVFPYDVEQAP